MSDPLVQRRFFHKNPVRIPVNHCYDFIIYPNGLLSNFPDVKAGQNIMAFLYCLSRHMSAETTEGKDTNFKDIAQTFWPSQAYLANQIGCTQGRVSEALKVLTTHGVLVHEVKRGKGQKIAFSSKAIEAWARYSKDQHIKEMQAYEEPVKPIKLIRSPDVANTVTGCGQIRSPDVANTVTGCGSIIEDKDYGLRKGDSVNGLGGIKNDPNQPIGGAIDLAKRIEPLFRKPRGKGVPFIDYKKHNAFMAKMIKSRGLKEAEAFVDWVTREFSTGVILDATTLVWLEVKYDHCKANGLQESYASAHN